MFKLLDADRHVTEPGDMWAQYVDEQIFKTAPVSLIERRVIREGEYVTVSEPEIAGYPALGNWSKEIALASLRQKSEGKKALFDGMHPISQLCAMDATGIDIAYLMPNFAMNIVNHGEISAEVSLAYADAYNRWLLDYVAVMPSRLKAVGIISRHDPANMLGQLDKVIAYGWRAVTIRPEVIKGRIVGHRDYHDFYTACADNSIAVIFHGSTHLYGDTVGTERFTSRFGLHACSHPMELQMAFVSLLESGVLENNPKLKIGLLEGGCSWVPHWLWRLDNVCYPELPELTRDAIKKPPSAYFKQHCWVNAEPGEPCIHEVIKLIGHQRLVFGTDFPHLDHLDCDPVKLFNPGLGLTEQQLEDIFENNPRALFEGEL